MSQFKWNKKTKQFLNDQKGIYESPLSFILTYIPT